MLEVGRIEVDGAMHHAWNRAHFGAWCVVSAPLILGLDVTQTAAVGAVIDVITNREAIAVNQEWAGHPGALVWSELGSVLGYPAARACTPTNPALKQKGWSLSEGDGGKASLVAPGGGCLKIEGCGYPGGAGGLVVVSCNSSDPAQVCRLLPTLPTRLTRLVSLTLPTLRPDFATVGPATMTATVAIRHAQHHGHLAHTVATRHTGLHV